MKVLVVGGTGKVGSAAVSSLLESGASVRVLTRSREAAGLPDAVELVAGDLEAPESLTPAFAGADRAALILPLHPDGERLGSNAVRAAADAGIERLVFLSIFGLDHLPDAVHTRAKRSTEAEIDRLGVPASVVRANNFFQNDLAAAPAITEFGVYSIPLGPVGCNSVDTRDVGEAMANLLTQEDWSPATIPVVGAESITGEGAAQTWSDAMGRPVRYGSADLDAWAAQMSAHMPDWLVEALASMYREIAQNGLLASEEEIASSERVLGHPPRRYSDFVAELAARGSVG